LMRSVAVPWGSLLKRCVAVTSQSTVSSRITHDTRDGLAMIWAGGYPRMRGRCSMTRFAMLWHNQICE
jgi:hypothetical protein